MSPVYAIGVPAFASNVHVGPKRPTLGHANGPGELPGTKSLGRPDLKMAFAALLVAADRQSAARSTVRSGVSNRHSPGRLNRFNEDIYVQCFQWYARNYLHSTSRSEVCANSGAYAESARTLMHAADSRGLDFFVLRNEPSKSSTPGSPVSLRFISVILSRVSFAAKDLCK